MKLIVIGQIGNASSFQAPFIEDTYRGIINMMHELGVSAPSTLPAYATQNIESLYVDRTVVCTSSVSLLSFRCRFQNYS